jgi:peptide/nickel transport system substrate-binding protein
LRRGIRYSTGGLVKPEDFRRELERVFELGNGYPQSFYTGIVGAQACMSAPSLFSGRASHSRSRCSLARGILVDDSTDTITFHLTAPDPDFLYKLAFPWADAVPADTPDRDLGRTMPPATGPYMTKSISPGRGTGRYGDPLAFGTWTLVRNPRFHEWSAAAQPAGYPDRIVLREGQNPERAVNDLQRGALDVVVPVPADRLSEISSHYTQLFHSEPLGATDALSMNTRVAPFNNILVRRALNFAIDRARLSRLAGGRFAAQPTCQILPPDMPGYRPYCPYTLAPGPDVAWTGQNMAKAEQLVSASGTRGAKVTLLVPPPDASHPTSKVGRYIVTVLDRLGYRTSLRVVRTETAYFETLGDSRSRIQIGWFTWMQDYPAPADFIAPVLTCGAFAPHSQSNVNAAEFCEPRIDRALRRAQSLEAGAPGVASQSWAALDRQITDQAPWVTLYNPRLDIATSSRVGNYQYHPFFGLLLDQLWVH